MILSGPSVHRIAPDLQSTVESAADLEGMEFAYFNHCLDDVAVYYC